LESWLLRFRDVRVVVITGANRGTGRSIAEAFYDHGDCVVALNKTLCGESWLREIKCDLRSKVNIRDAVRRIAEEFGRIDIVVHNAAIRRFASIDTISDEQWEDSVAVNLNAVFWLTQETAAYLIASRGFLVFMGSHAGMHFFEKGAAYCCTKAAVHAFAEVAIRDFRYKGVRATLIAPGAISNRPKENDEWKIKPEEIGKIVVYLSSMPSEVIPGFVELRPSQPLKFPFDGIELLQYY